MIQLGTRVKLAGFPERYQGTVVGYGTMHEQGKQYLVYLVRYDELARGWLRNEMTGVKEVFIRIVVVTEGNLTEIDEQ